MLSGHERPEFVTCLDIADSFLRAVRATRSRGELGALIEAVSREMGFRYYALIHHDDLRQPRPDRVAIMDYPPAITERLVGERRYRRDPIIRGCNFAGNAFLWSELHRIMVLDRKDRASFEYGIREGLSEGITVPCMRLGERIGSCTFAGVLDTHRARRLLGLAQTIGIFAFQAARRLLPSTGETKPISRLLLQPRERDCVILAGRGYSNKQIARELKISPSTVDCYMTAAREQFDAHSRAELVASALLAGEIGLDELKKRPS